jgi:hypothetical protein
VGSAVEAEAVEAQHHQACVLLVSNPKSKKDRQDAKRDPPEICTRASVRNCGVKAGRGTIHRSHIVLVSNLFLTKL